MARAAHTPKAGWLSASARPSGGKTISPTALSRNTVASATEVSCSLGRITGTFYENGAYLGLPLLAACGLVVVLGWLVVRGRLADLRLRARPVVLIVSGVVLGVHWALLFEAYKRIGVDTTILIVFIGPVLWAVAAPFFLHERLRRTSVVALAIAFGVRTFDGHRIMFGSLIE